MSSNAPEPPLAAVICPGCETQIAPALLSCPVCHRLVHASRLQQLAAAAELATEEGRIASALANWREAIGLLPPGARQALIISERIARLSEQISSSPASEPRAATGHRGSAGAIAAAGALILFMLTKGKLLLLGLANAGTFFSMVAALGVYWTAFGWKFALGLVLTTYVHEIGHVAALRRYGIKSTAPMFIPGFGAMVRLKDSPATVIEDARVGLAGPLWGLGATVATYALFAVTRWPSLQAIAHVSAFINLFNLLPVWQLDGGRGLRSLSRGQRWLIAALAFLAWCGIKEGFLLVLTLLTLVRAAEKGAPQRGDRAGLLLFCLLLLSLAALSAPQLATRLTQ